MDYSARLARLKRKLGRKKGDAILIGQPENRRYLSGYSAMDHGIAESSGLLLITRKSPPFLLTDFRFREQAEREAVDFEVKLYPKGVIALLRKMLPKLGVKRLFFESDYTLHSTAQRLHRLSTEISVEITPTTGLVDKMRMVKSEDEIKRIRKSVRMNEKVFRDVYSALTGRETEIEVALKISTQMRLRGAERESFDTIVATSENSSLPHAVPSGKALVKNSPLLIDMGLVLNGYCSDMTRSFCLGKPSKKYKKIHRIVRRAQLAAMAKVRAGVSAKKVDRAARQVIANAGYGDYFGHALGHGVGMAVHEAPRVSTRSTLKLRAGMIITIEPGIYLPGWGGIRLEDMVVVREDGCENLNQDTTWLDI